MSTKLRVKRATAHIKDKKWHEALTESKKGLEKNPKHYTLLVCQGKALKELSRMRESKEVFESAITIQPQNPTAYHALLEGYLEGSKKKARVRICELAAHLLTFDVINEDRLEKYVDILVENASSSEKNLLVHAQKALVSRNLYNFAFRVSVEVAKYTDDGLYYLLGLEFISAVWPLNGFAENVYDNARRRLDGMVAAAKNPRDHFSILSLAHVLLLRSPTSFHATECPPFLTLLDDHYVLASGVAHKDIQSVWFEDISRFCQSVCFATQFNASYRMWLLARFGKPLGIDHFKRGLVEVEGDVCSESFFTSQALSNPEKSVYVRQQNYAINLFGPSSGVEVAKENSVGVILSILLSRAFVVSGSFRNALSHINNVIFKSKKTKSILLGEAQYYKSAINTFTELKSKDNAEESAWMSHRAFSTMQTSFYEGKPLQGAIDVYAKCLLDVKDYAAMHHFLANTSNSLGGITHLSDETACILAWGLYKAGKVDESLNLWNELRSKGQVRSSVHKYWHGETLFELKKYKECAEEMEEIIVESEIRFADIYFFLGNSLLELGNEDKALDYLVRGINVDPRCSSCGESFCQLMEGRNELDEIGKIARAAMKHYDEITSNETLEVLEAVYTEFDGWRPRGIRWAAKRAAYFNIKEGIEHKASIRILNGVLSDADDNASPAENVFLFELLAISYLRAGMVVSSLENFRRVSSIEGGGPRAVSALYHIGQISLSLHEYSDALSAYTASLELDSGFEPSMCGISETNIAMGDEAFENGYFGCAGRCYQNAIEVIASFPEAKSEVRSHLLIITACIRMAQTVGRHEYCFDSSSRNLLENCFSLAESHIMELGKLENNIGLVKRLSGRISYCRGLMSFNRYQRGHLEALSDARDHFNAALVSSPTDICNDTQEEESSVHHALAATYFHDPALAVKHLALSVSGKELSANIPYTILGFLLLKHGAFSMARRSFALAHTHDPHSSAAWLGLSCINQISEGKAPFELMVKITQKNPGGEIQSSLSGSSNKRSVQAYAELVHSLDTSGVRDDVFTQYAIVCMKHGKHGELLRTIENLFGCIDFSRSAGIQADLDPPFAQLPFLLLFGVHLESQGLFKRAEEVVNSVRSSVKMLLERDGKCETYIQIARAATVVGSRIYFRQGRYKDVVSLLSGGADSPLLLGASKIMLGEAFRNDGIKSLSEIIGALTPMGDREKYYHALFALSNALELSGQVKAAATVLENEGKREEIRSILARTRLTTGESIWYHIATALNRYGSDASPLILDHDERMRFICRSVISTELPAISSYKNVIDVLQSQLHFLWGKKMAVFEIMQLVIRFNSACTPATPHEFNLEMVLDALRDELASSDQYMLLLLLDELLIVAEQLFLDETIFRRIGDTIINLIHSHTSQNGLSSLLLANAILLRAKATVNCDDGIIALIEYALRVYTSLLAEKSIDGFGIKYLRLRIYECQLKLSNFKAAEDIIKKGLPTQGMAAMTTALTLFRLNTDGYSIGDLFVGLLSHGELKNVNGVELINSTVYIAAILTSRGYPDEGIETLRQTIAAMSQSPSLDSHDEMIILLNLALLSSQHRKMRLALSSMERAKKLRLKQKIGDSLFSFVTGVVYFHLRKYSQSIKLLSAASSGDFFFHSSEKKIISSYILRAKNLLSNGPTSV